MKNLLFILIILFTVNMASSQEFKYVGVQKCKMCHNAEDKGKQFAIWSESKHSKAFEVLLTPEAAKVAKERNIADPSKDQKCLKCHSTAAMVSPEMNAGITVEEGISCETCHGLGSSYKSMSIMKDRDMAIKNGLILPNEAVCVKCHNPESPSYKPFDFAVFSAKIAHPLPNKAKP